MSIELGKVLALVGKLDDSPGDDTPRARFRQFLRENVLEAGKLRDYVEECLREKGDNYSRALQDLVTFAGNFLGFEVGWGRYKGVVTDIGFDGHWKSPTGFHVVVEVKTSGTFAIATSTLVNYVDDMISAKMIPSWDEALGLYVMGRPDTKVRQLENDIVAEKRSDQLRVISVDSLLSLAELMSDYDIEHEDVLAVLRPSGPRVDPIVELMTAIVGQAEGTESEGAIKEVAVPEEEYRVGSVAPDKGMAEDERVCWLTPVKATPEQSAEDCIRTLVAETGIYALGDNTPGRKHIRPGDRICFYISGGVGVAAHAEVASVPKHGAHAKVRDGEKYPWVFRVKKAKLYLKKPTVVDLALRSRLDAFEGRNPDGAWGWFVQATRKVSERDFGVLTGQKG